MSSNLTAPTIFPLILPSDIRASWLGPLVFALVVMGCVPTKPSSQMKPGPAGNAYSARRLIITPETTLLGKVASINANYHFVILTFPIGRLPAQNQILNVYRGGLKVGEVKVTNWQLDDNTVADVITGDIEPGDEIRDK